MNSCAIQQNGVVRSSQRRESVVCPKPRRVGILNGSVDGVSRPLCRPFSNQVDLSDSKAGSELLDIILAKGGGHSSTQLGSTSSPFFCGSPPSRVSNPLIQDARFREEKPAPTMTVGYTMPSSPALPSPAMSGSPLSPTSAAARKGGCVRANFGHNPAVRVEGFDCLDRDRSRNCRILALA